MHKRNPILSHITILHISHLRINDHANNQVLSSFRSLRFIGFRNHRVTRQRHACASRQRYVSLSSAHLLLVQCNQSPSTDHQLATLLARQPLATVRAVYAPHPLRRHAAPTPTLSLHSLILERQDPVTIIGNGASSLPGGGSISNEGDGIDGTLIFTPGINRLKDRQVTAAPPGPHPTSLLKKRKPQDSFTVVGNGGVDLPGGGSISNEGDGVQGTVIFTPPRSEEVVTLTPVNATRKRQNLDPVTVIGNGGADIPGGGRISQTADAGFKPTVVFTPPRSFDARAPQDPVTIVGGSGAGSLPGGGSISVTAGPNTGSTVTFEPAFPPRSAGVEAKPTAIVAVLKRAPQDEDEGEEGEGDLTVTVPVVSSTSDFITQTVYPTQMFTLPVDPSAAVKKRDIQVGEVLVEMREIGRDA